MFDKVIYTAWKWQFRWNKNDVWRWYRKIYRTVLHMFAIIFVSPELPLFAVYATLLNINIHSKP